MIRVLFVLLFVSVSAESATYFVSPAATCATNGNGLADSCAATVGGAGRFNSLNNANNVARSGDTVRVHTGTYAERLYGLWPGVTWNTFGDGHVTVTTAGVSGITNGHIYIPNSASSGFLRNVTDFSMIGSANSKWLFDGNGTGQPWMNCYSGSPKTNCLNMTFQFVEWTDYDSGGIVQGNNVKFLDCSGHHNGWQGLNYDTATNSEVRRCTFYENDRDTNWANILDNDPNTLPNNPPNSDGFIIQDTADILIEDVETYGQYDGLDIGSQCTDPACNTAAGPVRTIARRIKTYDNTNGQTPASDVRTGWLTYEYIEGRCKQDIFPYSGFDCGWAISPIYSSSTQTEYWHLSYDDTRYIWSNTLTATRARFGVYNSLVISRLPSAQDQKDGLVSTGGTASWSINNTRYWANVSGNNVILGTGNTSVTAANAGAARTAFGWTNAAARNYTLTPSSPAIDAGRFFTHAATAGSNTVTLKTIRNPRRYFWLGTNPTTTADTIQIEGVGTRKIVAMTGSNDPTIEGGTITLDAPATWVKGAGVHLPWCGNGPDQGAYERCP